MPRIAASLVVLSTLAFCIGLNTVRYPIVWEMVAPNRLAESTAASTAPQTKEQGESPAQPASIPGLAARAEGEAATADVAPPGESGPVGSPSTNDVNSASQDSLAATSEASGSFVNQQPVAADADAVALSANYAGYAGFANGTFMPASSGDSPTVQGSTARDFAGRRGAAGAPSANANFWPAEVVPSARYAGSVGAGNTPAARKTELPMVRIVRDGGGGTGATAPAASGHSGWPRGAPVALTGQAFNGVERLPPTDQVTTVSGAGAASPSTAPIAYPRTGL